MMPIFTLKLSLPFLFLAHMTFPYHYKIENGLNIYYNITYTNLCYQHSGLLSVHQGLTIPQCVSECRFRSHCRALTYKRRHRLCELFLYAEEKDELRDDCISININDTDVEEMPCENCPYGQTCDPNQITCVHRECLNTTSPERGQVLGNLNHLGNMLKYTCTHGYRVQGNKMNAVCLDTGEWNISTKCIMDCGNPLSVANSYVTSVSVDVAKVTCDIGYRITNSTIVCSQYLSWHDITCDLIECGEPPVLENGQINLFMDGQYFYMDIATVTCDHGYLPTRLITHCTNSGMWDTVECRRVGCGYSPYVVKGSALLDKPDGIFYQDTATITCNGWYQTETTSIMCTISGIWESAICIDCYPGAPQGYFGKTNLTQSGKQCQRWDSQTPHVHDIDKELQYLPETTASEASNYCRTAEAGNHEPWCYTMDPSTEWEYCDVEKCPWS